MGISAGGSQGGKKSDINVTPLVDIVLVLLIIFLVATPILMRHVSLEVPRKIDEDTEDTTMAARQIVVTVKADGTLIVKEGNSEKKVPRVYDLAEVIQPMIEAKKLEKIVFMDFEDEVVYSDVVTAMDLVKGAGAEKVALKIREDDKNGAQ